jgi:hypothetical protein
MVEGLAGFVERLSMSGEFLEKLALVSKERLASAEE